MKRALAVFSAIVLLAALGLAAFRNRARYELWSAERGLNNLYGQHRPFAYRWPGAPYRTEASSPLPPAAHRELSEISLRLELLRDKLASDVHWLRLRGRVALLNGNHDRAVAQFRRARLLSHQDPAVTAELAVAYALRAEVDKRATDYGIALDYAAQATSGENSPPFALFNLAALAEKIPIPRVALEEWQATLASEKDSGWRGETETRKNQLARKLETREHNREALRDPAAIHWPVAQLPGALEVMQREALQNWVLREPPPREALDFLASEFAKHKDNWWRDFLSVPPDRHANELLSQALSANVEGRYQDTEMAAEQAEAAFQRAGNVAGRLRARRERLEASHRGDSTKICPQLLQGVMREVAARSYRWVAGQITLDEITCRAIDLQGASLDDRIRGFQQIDKTGFEGIALRALAFLSEPSVSAGSPVTAWTRASEGLPRFWNSVERGYRGFHFCWNLAEASRLAGYMDGSRILLREGTLDYSEDPNLGMRANVLAYLAVAEARTGHHQAAASAFAEAHALSKNARAERYSYQIQFLQASAESLAGRPASALALLDAAEAESQATAAPNQWDRADFLNQKGTVLLQLKRYREAEDTFQQLVAVQGAMLRGRRSATVRNATTRRYESAFGGLIEAQIYSGKTSAASLASWLEFRTAVPGARFDFHRIAKNTSVAAFAVLPGGVSVWFADSGGVEQHWVTTGVAEELATRLAGLAADPEVPESAIRDAARETERILLSPFKGHLAPAKSGPVPTLIIDAEGALQKIPWAVLENQAGESLTQRFGLVQVKGQMPETTQETRRITSASTALVVADPLLDQRDDSFPPLKEALAEGQRVAKRFHSPVYAGKDATEEKIAAKAPLSVVFHFAGHGVSNGGMGGLLLAGQPKFLTAEEISSWPLSKLQLVVLSSCSSGVAAETASVDSDLLMRGFLNAGAARVLASSWAVDSFATAQFMDLFYARLLSGKYPADALRGAILEARNNPATAHPSVWAAFELYGKP